MADAQPMPGRLLRRFRRTIQGYHTEVEELIRVLQALEAVGLVTYSIKKVQRTHDTLERYLEELDAGTFGSKQVAKLVAQLERGLLPSYSPDGAFESPRGTAVAQMETVAKRRAKLHDLVFESDVEVSDLELEEAAQFETQQEADE